jgi:stage III sporulation protein AF
VVLIGMWVRQLIFIIMFATVAEVLLPAGDLRRYVKMVLGLVVMVAVITPVVDLWKGADWLEPLLFVELDAATFSGGQAWAKPEDPAVLGAHIAQQTLAGVVKQMAEEEAKEVKKDEAKNLTALLFCIDHVVDAAVDVSGASPVINIKAAPAADLKQLSERAVRLAGAVMGSAPEGIVVNVEIVRELMP